MEMKICLTGGEVSHRLNQTALLSPRSDGLGRQGEKLQLNGVAEPLPTLLWLNVYLHFEVSLAWIPPILSLIVSSVQ
jgi:hypothetical protein